ncbi:hypothetical protein B7463_g8251, partial [Scytalidium lignicola]
MCSLTFDVFFCDLTLIGLGLVDNQTEELIKGFAPDVEILSIPTDIANEESVVALFDKIKEHFGKADVLINNAGVLNCFPDKIADANSKDWWAGFEINVKGSFLVTQHFLRLLGSENCGTIINVTSYSAVGIDPGESQYALTKLANLQFSTSLAVERPNVVAVSLRPGMVASEMTLESFKKFSVDTPELAGGVSVWLATKEASFMNGRFMDVNWDVAELVERKNEILQGNLFKLDLTGNFGQS